MTQREAERSGVIAEVVAGRMRQVRASQVLGLSCRQVKRLVRAWRQHGAAGLRSGHRGRPGNRRYPEVLREQVLALARERYADFGPTLLGEYLVSQHQIQLSPETLRQWLIQAGLWVIKQRKRNAHRARDRRPRFGELVQVDGSPHDWLEGRGPRCTMIVFIDDATSQVLYARLVPAETTQAYFDGIHAHLTRFGRPLAYYSDRHSIFRINGQTRVKDGQTQVERALQALNIELICANSPQAKGRVERVHQTFQDRFVKALRLADIDTIEAADALLQTYLPDHNTRFAKPPRCPEDAHRPLHCDDRTLARILSPHHERTVNRQGAIRFEGDALQINAPYTRRMIGQRLTLIVERQAISLWHGDQCIPYTQFNLGQWHHHVQDRKALDAHLDQRTATHAPVKPTPHHPWRRFVEHPPRQWTTPQKGTSLSGTTRGHF